MRIVLRLLKIVALSAAVVILGFLEDIARFQNWWMVLVGAGVTMLLVWFIDVEVLSCGCLR